MGCCDSKKKNQIGQTVNCPRCGTQLAATTTVNQLNRHIRGCNRSPRLIEQPFIIDIGNVGVQLQQHPQPVLRQQPSFPGGVPSQTVMDDVNNGGVQRFYWSKELLPGSKNQYNWLKKPIPPLPEQNVKALLEISWNKIKELEFSTKQTWFRLNLERMRIPWQQGSDNIHVHKESFLMSTLGAVHGIKWHKEVKIVIAGEEKVLDAGGLLREWTNLTMKEIVHPESGMFKLAETEDVTYKINYDADPVDHVLDCFRLLGIIVGKAIFERIPINAFLDRTIIRHMLGQQVQIDDIFYFDKQLYQSWSFLLNNQFDPSELMEYFMIYRSNKGDTYELKPKGSETIVDNENKEEYVRLWYYFYNINDSIEYYTFESIKPFIQAFLNQLYSIIPRNFLKIFDPIELEMILYGIPFINLDDWRDNTEYKGSYYRTHQTILWFWLTLGEFDQPKLTKFLQFCTGSQRTPVEGFRKLESNRGNCAKFCIESVPFTRANPYPKAHTCFNRLELPIYDSQENLQIYLKAIVDNDLDGVFGME